MSNEEHKGSLNPTKGAQRNASRSKMTGYIEAQGALQSTQQPGVLPSRTGKGGFQTRQQKNCLYILLFNYAVVLRGTVPKRNNKTNS